MCYFPTVVPASAVPQATTELARAFKSEAVSISFFDCGSFYRTSDGRKFANIEDMRNFARSLKRDGWTLVKA